MKDLQFNSICAASGGMEQIMLNILVVEDEAPIREWIVYTISSISEEFKVVGSAKNGMEGYELAINLKPDLILTDIKMPIMDGLELSKKVKEFDANISVVLLTNYEEFSYAKQALSYGVEEYLVKSDIRTKELKELFNKINEKLMKKANLANVTKNLTEIDNKPSDITENKDYSKAVVKALKFIDENYGKNISLNDISNHVFLSSEYFSRLFKEEVGENFVAYLTIYRMKKARDLIRNTSIKISQIAQMVGYPNAGYFSKIYKKYNGVTPEEDRFESNNLHSKK